MRKWWVRVFAGLVLAVVVFALFQQGVLERLELVTYDWRLKTTSPTTDRLLPFVIVGITENFQRKVGQEFSREYFTRFLDLCHKEGATVVGFDIFFPDLKKFSTDTRLAEALSSRSQTVLPVFSPESLREKKGIIPRANSLRGSHQLFSQAATSSGHINVLPDSDRTVRRLPFLLQYNKTRVPQLSLELVRLWSGAREIRAELIRTWRRPSGIIPVDESGTFYIRFLKPQELAKYFHSFEDILLRNYPKNLFKGKIVLVGQTIVGAKNADLVPTPFGIQFGVMVQAAALWTALADAYIWRLDKSLILLLLVLSGIMTSFIFFGRNPWLSTLFLALVISGIMLGSRASLQYRGIFLETVPFLLVAGTSYVSSLVFSLHGSLTALFKKEAAFNVLEETEREIAHLLKPEEFVHFSESDNLPTFQTNGTIEATSEIALRTLVISLGIESAAILAISARSEPQVLVSSGKLWSLFPLKKVSELVSGQSGPVILSSSFLRRQHLSEEVKNVMIISSVKHPGYRIAGLFVNKSPTVFSSSRRFTLDDARLAETLLLQTLIAVQNARLTLALKNAQLETIFRLAVAVEYRDRETGLHIHRVSEYAGVIAESLGLPDVEVELIRTAMPMHDIGKIAIPDNILLKAGNLTEEEKQVVRQHPLIGARILHGSSSLVLKIAEVIALNHQERYDGSGYPQGLAGQSIPLYGRIAAIADIFDALSSKRIYKQALNLEESYRVLEKEAGHSVDPGLVEFFLREKEKVGQIYRRYLEEEKKGIWFFDEGVKPGALGEG